MQETVENRAVRDLPADEIFDRLGDRITDAEVGYREGTLQAACEIVEQWMSDDDALAFCAEDWREDVAVMLATGDGTEHLDTSEVLEAMTAAVLVRGGAICPHDDGVFAVTDAREREDLIEQARAGGADVDDDAFVCRIADEFGGVFAVEELDSYVFLERDGGLFVPDNREALIAALP